MIKALIVRIFEKSRRKWRERKERREENKTNRPYVIKLDIDLLISNMYNVPNIGKHYNHQANGQETWVQSITLNCHSLR